MDILSFVNSQAIKEHLKNIDYNFSSLETAWLIYSCNNISFEEKKKAWLQLIECMPDCVVPSRMNCKGWDSLHEFLKQYIRIIDDEIASFLGDESIGIYAYRYSYLYSEDRRWTEEYDTVFPSLEKCIGAYQEDVEDLDETYNPEKTGVIRYRIRRQSLTETSSVFEIEFLGNGQVSEILRNSDRSEATGDIINDSFEGLWFDIPTPFKKGDIVWVPTENNKITWDCDGGFVLLGLSSWTTSEFLKESGDNSDMNGYGYFVNDNGTVYREVMFSYMDLDYYTGPYKLNEKILPALSKFVKGDIEIDLLLCAYRKCLLDVAADDVMFKSWYSEEMLNEIGLK